MATLTAAQQPDHPPAPTVLAYGVGVDSTGLLVELASRGEPPDLVLTADTGVEKPLTYAYLDVIGPWMAARGIRHEIVRYEPRRFKHWPPYHSLLEMALTNGTLPSKSLGGSSCSLKYTKAPQDAFLKTWQPAIDAWARGQKVVRLIGFDAGPRDTIRHAHAAKIEDPLYNYRHPLRDWGWTRGLRAPYRGRRATRTAQVELLVLYRHDSAGGPRSARMVPAPTRPGRGAGGAPPPHRRRVVAQDHPCPARPNDRFHQARTASARRRDRPDRARCAARSDPLPGRRCDHPARGTPDDAGLARPVQCWPVIPACPAANIHRWPRDEAERGRP